MDGIDGNRVIYSFITNIIIIIVIIIYIYIYIYFFFFFLFFFFFSLQENMSILKLQIRQPVIMQSCPLRCQEINRHVA